MIKANELRIGNYLKAPLGEIMQVKQIGHIKNPEFIFCGYLNGFGINAFEPIQLTEEWLLKFGANKYGLSYEYDRFLLTYKKEYKYWGVQNKSYYYLSKVEFVHEWQNFVFVMNGQELELK